MPQAIFGTYLLSGALTFRLSDLANKMHCPKYCMEHTYTKELFFIYLEFKFNWCLLVYELAPPYPEEKGKTKKKKNDAGNSRFAGGRVNKQGNFTNRFVSGSCKNLWAKILKVHIKALTVFSHIHHPEALKTLLSQDSILEKGSHPGNGRQDVRS